MPPNLVPAWFSYLEAPPFTPGLTTGLPGLTDQGAPLHNLTC